ncbi:MAG TPA: VRR-NUC domain-containing protein [bacterium]|nr:VRR-NUC domain-containing protein [bacterium]
MTESQIQRLIFESQSQLNQKLFRNSAGYDKQRKIRYGIPNKGGCDLLGWTVINNVAVFTGIEVKSATGRAAERQLCFIDAIRKDGGIAGICRSCEDVERMIDEYVEKRTD